MWQPKLRKSEKKRLFFRRLREPYCPVSRIRTQRDRCRFCNQWPRKIGKYKWYCCDTADRWNIAQWEHKNRVSKLKNAADYARMLREWETNESRI